MRATIAAVLLLGTLGQTWARDCELPRPKGDSPTYTQILVIQQADACFGGERDHSPIVSRTRESIASITKLQESALTADAYLVLRMEAANILTMLGDSLATERSGAEDAWQRRMDTTIERLEVAANRMASPGDDAFNAEEWKADASLAIFDGQLKLSEPLEDSCVSGYTDKCKMAQRSAAEILRHAELASNVLSEAVRIVSVIPKYRDLKVLDDQWTYYFEHGHSQYPWELMLNQARFSRSAKCEGSSFGSDATQASANCFARPPNDQIIFLHLDAAPEYAGSRGDSGSQVNAVALIELLGYMRLNYARGGGGRRVYGGSIIATVSPETAGKRFGWGIMIHATEKISVGIARRDLGRGRDENTWLVSADLGKLLDMTSVRDRLDFRKSAGDGRR